AQPRRASRPARPRPARPRPAHQAAHPHLAHLPARPPCAPPCLPVGPAPPCQEWSGITIAPSAGSPRGLLPVLPVDAPLPVDVPGATAGLAVDELAVRAFLLGVELRAVPVGDDVRVGRIVELGWRARLAGVSGLN